MNFRSILSIGAVTALGLALLPVSAVAKHQSLKSQIVGSWTLVSWEQTRADGSKFHRFGDSPKGINTFDAAGHYSLIILRPDLPKVSSGSPEKPSPDEAQAIAAGSIAYFGTYSVDEATKTVNLKIDGTTLANQLGMAQKRTIISIGADGMKYANVTAVGGGKIETAWKRAQ
jgi:hypothetical protein